MGYTTKHVALSEMNSINIIMLNYRKLNIDMSIKNEKCVLLFPYEKQILSTEMNAILRDSKTQ
jgi:hypothetical protein